MELKNIVLHQIIKKENEKPKPNVSSHLLAVNEVTTKFIDKLIKSYTSKSPTYGAFDEDIINHPFQQNIKNYFNNENFLKFSTEAMKTLKSSMDIAQAKGGYVVFAHYIEQKKDFIVTVMLDDNAESFVVNDNLGIDMLLTLDIEKVARANRVNWQEWQNKQETYLSFIKGTRGVSNYFAKKFIGCTDFTSAQENSKNLEIAIASYMKDNEFSHNKKIDTRHRLKQYFDKQIDAREDIMIESISAVIDSLDPAKFTSYVHENENLKVGNFKSDRKSHFKNFEIKTLKGDGYKLEYSFNSCNIELDKEREIIIIKNVPKSTFED